ncbi:hypothetical protein [Mangrovimonas sp. YM274]|uniref:hypothetical protein n=1 Tax=Mangrovimonas sp. YM274 TaxID=3070660 RepID=UPI0027DE02FB|nr:hypothetical protein [Mangrovimonas sp. YM274]WMI69639.1 hypothetical protein RBH95_04540 [Mangrovimonas sp. YM274]
MKKYLFILSIFTLFLTSCDEQDPELYDGPSLIYFTEGTSGRFFVEDTPESSTQIVVGVTKAASTDRTFTVAVNEELTTATPDQYEFQSYTFTIPANEYLGYVEVFGNFDAISTQGSTLAIELVDIQNAEVANFDTTFLLGLNQYCPVDLPGTSFNGSAFIGTSLVNNFQGELVPTGGLNEYSIANAWGEFVAAATGDDSYLGQYYYPVVIQIGCDYNVSLTPANTNGIPGAGGTGVYNDGAGVISLSLTQGLFTEPFNVEVDLVLVP